MIQNCHDYLLQTQSPLVNDLSETPWVKISSGDTCIVAARVGNLIVEKAMEGGGKGDQPYSFAVFSTTPAAGYKRAVTSPESVDTTTIYPGGKASTEVVGGWDCLSWLLCVRECGGCGRGRREKKSKIKKATRRS